MNPLKPLGTGLNTMGYPVYMYMHIYCLALTYQIYQLYYVRFLICIYNPENKYQYSLWYLTFNTLGCHY